MTLYSFGNIILIGFPHTDLQKISKRPAIVLYVSQPPLAIGSWRNFHLG